MSDRVAPGRPTPEASPHDVRLVVNVHHWDDITFLHWPFHPADVAAVLPEDLGVSTYDGAAWVGITPFFIRVRPPGLPMTPPRWAFPETNVRTYVVGPDGGVGLWFLHMEVTAAWFVAVLRSLGLPYVRREMVVDRRSEDILYRSAPPAPPDHGGHDILVRPGRPLHPPHGDPRDRFLTARWSAYHARGPLLLRTPVDHPSWPLRTAEVERCEVEGLFAAAGLPQPTGPPVAHFSPGVRVEVGRPRVVRMGR